VKTNDDNKAADSFRRFRDNMRALLAVPKKELEDEMAAWKKRRAKKVAARRRRSA
jgi:hypothetical protein